MAYCLNCGAPVEESNEFCPSCGAFIPWDMIQAQRQEYDGSMQREISPDRYEQQVQVQRGREKNKWAAVLMCFFFGVFGVHRFYEGKIGTGLLYLFTGGLFGIGVIVDLIILLCKPNPYFV
ncbi:MAG: TM2 domain-containing protein [Lachnospiraceae bacterium]|nr:TM2 domain-containing protein [Lachnospiraceae bacterium]